MTRQLLFTKTLTTLAFVVFICFQNEAQTLPPSVDSAALFLENMFNWGHNPIYVFKDDNDAANNGAPHLEGNIAVDATHCDVSGPIEGRSNAKVVFPFSNSSSPFAIWRYTFPGNNYGQLPGFDLTGATTLHFWAKGSGTVEFLVGGTNRKPFYDSAFIYQDGVDVRSTGFIDLTSDWKHYSISLTGDTCWVFLDSISGATNKYPEIALMGNFNVMPFSSGADDGQGNTCIRIDWNGNNASQWGGGFFFPPGQSWPSSNGYDLTGVQRVKFKAKISQPGSVKFLMGKLGDSCNELSKVINLNTDWQWYTWELPTGDFSNVVGGFGWAVGGTIQTPSNSIVYLDSIYYEGIAQATDLSNVITGFAVAASESFNPDSAVVYFDNVYFDTDRLGASRFAQSFVTIKSPLDITQRNTAHSYDNALAIQAFLTLYKHTGKTKYLTYAKLVGDAFLYAMENDPILNEKVPPRSVYSAGIQPYWDGKIKMPGWYDEDSLAYYQDPGYWGFSSGNVGWAGLALTSLYQFTGDTDYLDAAEFIAQWCLDNTETSYGFTGGAEGWPDGQNFVTWVSSEHNLDLAALFTRLHSITQNPAYLDAAENAKTFIQGMWNNSLGCFYTGTQLDGVTPNASNYPTDVNSWYVQAIQDSTSAYAIQCMEWVKNNCYVEDLISPNYDIPLSGFDFNNDQDGIWLEGQAQCALTYKMLGQHAFADSLLAVIEYVQRHGPRNDSLGIVAAIDDETSTGFSWSYHNRLATAPTAYYIFAKLCENPYYLGDSPTTAVVEQELLPTPAIFPNPFYDQTSIQFSLSKAAHAELIIYDIEGKKIRTLLDSRKPAGSHTLTWNGKTVGGAHLPTGAYVCTLTVGSKKSSVIIYKI